MLVLTRLPETPLCEALALALLTAVESVATSAALGLEIGVIEEVPYPPEPNTTVDVQ
jgi:hypothetical protein